MTILCVLCTWHAIIASFDSESLEASFSGYLYLTLDEYNNQLAQIDNNQTNTNNTNETNQDWINKTDRVALIIFLLLYAGFHVIFSLWMYKKVNNE